MDFSRREAAALGQIEDNFRRIREELPPEVQIVAAAKGRTAGELAEVLRAGARLIGENYVQEAETALRNLPREILSGVECHLIGHLQSNKVNKALALFDMLQSIDSTRIAGAIDRRLDGSAPLPVLIQVNVAGEESKHGIRTENLSSFLEKISDLENIKVKGLMTMEPYYEDPEDARPHFRRMREIFETTSQMEGKGIEMQTLSMGMSHSYRIAIEEGATMVRLGTALFGPRR